MLKGRTAYLQVYNNIQERWMLRKGLNIKANWKPLCYKCEQNNMFSAEVYKLNELVRSNFRRALILKKIQVLWAALKVSH